jgi:nucleoside-diphosphate-sugar epimerase
MTEDSPVLTVDRDNPSEYLALDYVRAYGRTKLAGERALQATAQSVRYVVMRPTVVVDVDDIVGIRDWSLLKRVLAAHRYAHHIYVRDVSDALIWAMERALGNSFKPGSVEVFNLSDDEFQYPTHAEFMKRAFAASRDSRFRVPKVPGAADWAHDLLRFRIVSVRNPLWRMRFPSDRLRAAGYRRRFGMAHAHELALEAIRTKVESASGRRPGR